MYAQDEAKYQAILDANPIFLEKSFADDVNRWEKLNTMGEEAGIEPYSDELAAFVATGMKAAAKNKARN